MDLGARADASVRAPKVLPLWQSQCLTVSVVKVVASQRARTNSTGTPAGPNFSTRCGAACSIQYVPGASPPA